MFWPYRWPMHDREIVAAIVAGNPAGLAAAYDRYAAALHTYCRTLLAEPADAADAVQDTFIVAAAKLDGLRDPDRLRPWLYAVARNECHRRLRAPARSSFAKRRLKSLSWSETSAVILIGSRNWNVSGNRKPSSVSVDLGAP